MHELYQQAHAVARFRYMDVDYVVIRYLADEGDDVSAPYWHMEVFNEAVWNELSS